MNDNLLHALFRHTFHFNMIQFCFKNIKFILMKKPKLKSCRIGRKIFKSCHALLFKTSFQRKSKKKSVFFFFELSATQLVFYIINK